MPTYILECEQCKIRNEIFCHTYKQKPKKCKQCGGKLTQIFTPLNFVIKGWSPDNERKIERHIHETEDIMKEPLTESEAQVGMGLLAEREKEKGLEPGTLSGRARGRRHKGASKKGK